MAVARLSGIKDADKQEEDMQCPFCKEEALDGAVKCKHCGSIIATLPGRTGAVDQSDIVTAPFGALINIHQYEKVRPF
jgi:hypothetical protein